MQRLNINVSLIDKSELYEGKKGKYLSLTLFENRDGEDQYGNAGFIVQDIGKERREAGQKGPIIGNWKHVNTTPGRTVMPKTSTAPPTPPKGGYEPDPNDDFSEIPF
jgi:hypothetical protein